MKTTSCLTLATCLPSLSPALTARWCPFLFIPFWWFRSLPANWKVTGFVCSITRPPFLSPNHLSRSIPKLGSFSLCVSDIIPPCASMYSKIHSPKSPNRKIASRLLCKTKAPLWKWKVWPSDRKHLQTMGWAQDNVCS